MKRLEEWFSKDGASILLIGKIGIGKSRLVTEFLSGLSVCRRLHTRVLMPTPDEIRDKLPPLIAHRNILFLNDLHDYRGVDDPKLAKYIDSRQFRVVATIPAEKNDPDWRILSRFVWTEQLLLSKWTNAQAEEVARLNGIEFDPAVFDGTPGSVFSPESNLKRAYEALKENGKEVLKALKIAKFHLGIPVDFELASAITDRELRHADFEAVVSQGEWCKTYNAKAMLTDRAERCVDYAVSPEDAYRLQMILTRKDLSIEGRAEYLKALGNQFRSLGDHKNALDCYSHSIEVNPRSAQTWVQKAKELFDLDRKHEAIECLDKAVEIEPTYNEAWYMRWEGIIYSKPYGELLRRLFADGIAVLVGKNRRGAEDYANAFKEEYLGAVDSKQVDQLEEILANFENALTRKQDLEAFLDFKQMCYKKLRSS
jgi:tetratricopeptide (TPR) repeat protein